MDKMRMESPDLTAQNIEKIGELFPNCITEGADDNGNLKKMINFELLKQMLSDEVLDGRDEAYEFTWVGKKAAIVEANRGIRKTLRPCPEESKNWDSTENLYIEGDNLEVLKMLQESYLGKVKMIYIDPPYNTGNDFIYKDNFIIDDIDYKEQIGLFDEDGDNLFRNTETNGRFHSDWCSMIYPRLALARNLLSNDGVIFISIDDTEATQLQKICDEVYGSQNFVCKFVWQKKTSGGQGARFVLDFHEYILCYCKNINKLEQFTVDRTEEQLSSFDKSDEHIETRGKYLLSPLKSWLDYRPTLVYDILCPDGSKVNTQWICAKSTFEELKADGRIEFHRTANGWSIYKKQYENDKSNGVIPPSVLNTIQSMHGTREFGQLFIKKVFQNPKPSSLIKLLCRMCTKDDDIVVDFFSGSATTAHAVIHLNAEDGGKRKFIMVQLPEETDEKSEAYKAGYENICEIGKERIRRAGEKIIDELQKENQQLKLGEEPKVLPDIGFRVFKTADSNMNDVYYAASHFSQGLLEQMTSNIKEDRNDLDLLYACLLDWGLPLSYPHTAEVIDGCKIHTYNNGDLMACFDEKIPESVVREIAKRKPLRAVFRDAGFESSPEKINVFEIFKLYMPESADDISKRVKVL